ncbi:LicD family protein [Enterococcus faecium]|uniref:LicD family protein n=1 Tax=Enterococcus faecium TaxID=1352 RepID=UPI0029537EB6|nr:LicD family protein [Enterococcus faecium]MDV7691171.1 LicD family protein [Enterococcus faecium]
MEEKRLSLEEIHQELLELLVEFDRICSKLNISYFLSGGSMIGAVRHKGFIPWDDDLDLMMLRKDYNRFIQYSDELSPKYQLNCLELTPDWDYPFAKIDLTTTYINDEYRIAHHGLFLDIFPIDMLPDDKGSQEKIAKKIKLLDLLRGSGTKKKFKPSEKHKVLKTLLRPYANFRGPHYFAEKMDQYAKKMNNMNNNSNTAGVMVVPTHGTKEFLPKDAFSEKIEVEFENKKTYLPYGYKKYLENLYGDYMKMPPIDQRVPAHYDIYRKE